MNIDLNKIGYTENSSFKMIVEDGIKTARESEVEAFEYKVAELNGYEVKIVIEPKLGCFDTIDIDGVNGFGYSLAFDKD